MFKRLRKYKMKRFIKKRYYRRRRLYKKRSFHRLKYRVKSSGFPWGFRYAGFARVLRNQKLRRSLKGNVGFMSKLASQLVGFPKTIGGLAGLDRDWET